MNEQDKQTIDGLKDILAHLKKMTERAIRDNIASTDRDVLAITSEDQ